MNIKLVKVYHFTEKNNILLYYYLKSTTYMAPQTKQETYKYILWFLKQEL